MLEVEEKMKMLEKMKKKCFVTIKFFFPMSLNSCAFPLDCEGVRTGPKHP
jgi:hypothetical protein